MPKVKVIGKITLSPAQHNELLHLGLQPDDIATDNPHDTQEIIRRIKDAEAIIVNISTKITQEVIARCKNLKFIQTWSTGVDNIDCEAAKAAGIVVKNVPDFSVESVAEKTIAMMVFIANQIREANQDTMSGQWRYTHFQGVELKGKTLGIIGMGKIGARVAELASAFGMRILPANSKTSKEKLLEICASADFITLHCPLTPNTYHLLGEDEFNAMKKGVYLINNSRGGVVDEACLLHALNSGIVRYASIDVFETEPPDESNPLLKHPNVFFTPHIAWNTKEAVQRLSDECICNLKEYLVSIENSVLV